MSDDVRFCDAERQCMSSSAFFGGVVVTDDTSSVSSSSFSPFPQYHQQHEHRPYPPVTHLHPKPPSMHLQKIRPPPIVRLSPTAAACAYNSHSFLFSFLP